VRVPDGNLEEIRENGFTVVEGFLTTEEVDAARAAIFQRYPTPEDYFAAPDDYEWLTKSQFAGLRYFPFWSLDINRLAHHPDLVDAAERLLGSTDLELYKVELWAKYSGAIDYDQRLHRDFGNHSLVVPRRDGAYRQMTTFILLSDVTELDSPTKLVPLQQSQDVPLVPLVLGKGELVEHEVTITGPAGSLFVYRTDVLHRGTDFGAPGRYRLTLLADYQVRGPRWAGKMSWPNSANKPEMAEVIVNASVRERDLFGWPRPGDEYWNEQTLADVADRYPGIDISPYLR